MRAFLPVLLTLLLLIASLFVSGTVRRQVKSAGVRCFQCHDAVNPLDCDKWAICGEGEICFTQEFTEVATNAKRYHMGCEEKRRCDLYRSAQSILGLLGRREVQDSPSPCYECCESADCNSQVCLQSAGSQVAQVHVCPPTFYLGPHSCYYIASWGQTWDQARLDCQRRGADLVSLNSQEEQAYLVKQLSLLNSTSKHKDAYWTGGYYAMATADWNWVDMTKVNFTYWRSGSPVSESYMYNYRIAMMNPASSSLSTNWAWTNVATGTSYGFICETEYLK